MKTKYPPEWRTQSPWKKRFYARYMKWLERIGYFVVAVVIGAFIFAFNYRVDDVITADKVQIVAASTPVQMEQPVLIVRALVENFDEVTKGQDLFEIVEGEAAVNQYIAWEAVEKSDQPFSLVRPDVVIVSASQAGVLVFNPEQLGKRIEAGTELAQIRDYSQLTLTAKLAGQGVANAKSGGVATVKSISVSSASGVLVRGSTDQGAVVSGRLITNETTDKLASVLIGSPLEVRDDIALKVTGITKLDIDAELNLQPNSGGDGVQVDPASSIVLKADVLSGDHIATIQFAKLAPDVQSAVNQVLAESLKQKTIKTLNGESKTIAEIGDFNTVFQVSAAPGTGKSQSLKIPGTAISRNFEAKLKIQSPPAYLINAVRHADQEGQTVTVKVELKTGDRPIATLLLKRS